MSSRPYHSTLFSASIIAVGSEGPILDQFLSLPPFQIHRPFQLVAVVLSDASPTSGPHLSFVDGVWLNQSLPLHPSFEQLVTTDHNATLAFVDFQTKVN
ncbi:Serpin superfamily [Sesbania bispinosa]|nr:Serpin superfamily [Sesbania bispinosa]KAJ1425636.1 Serpin superfamily [Sesbania bispinosa]